jgi:hypothetical protein
MTRFGYFLFNVFLLAAIYGPVYLTGAKHASFSYAFTFFSLPYILVNLLMGIVSSIRWIMHPDDEHARDIATFLNATWIVALLTGLAIWLAGGIHRSPAELTRMLH